MIKIHYESDFKIIERFGGDDAMGFSVPFKFVYYTKDATYVASWDGQNYINCKPNEDGSLTVFFDQTGFKVGKLKVRREFYIQDSDFNDGVCNLVTDEATPISLVDGATDSINVENEIAPIYAKGDKGDTFTYKDMTTEDKEDLLSNVASGVSDIITEIQTIL